MRLWDLKSKEQLKAFKGHTAAVQALALSSNDTHLASGSAAGQILLHSIVTNDEVGRLAAPAAVTALQYSPFRVSGLGSAHDDGTVAVWDCNTRSAIVSFAKAHNAPASTLAFSPVNRLLLASAGLDKRALFFDIAQKKCVRPRALCFPGTAVLTD